MRHLKLIKIYEEVFKSTDLEKIRVYLMAQLTNFVFSSCEEDSSSEIAARTFFEEGRSEYNEE